MLTEQQKAYCYRISDLDMAAWLMAHGFELRGHEKVNTDNGEINIFFFNLYGLGTLGRYRWLLDGFDLFQIYQKELKQIINDRIN